MKDILTSPRMEDMKRKRRRRRLRFSILISILIVAIIGGVSYFSGNARFLISNITVTGTRIINTSDIESKVRELLAGKYIKLFTKANTFIYPKDTIYNNLLSKFPRIEKLSLSRDGLHTIHINIEERAGSYLYCGKDVPELSTDIGENCYFINDDGYIFDKAPYFSGNIYIKYYAPLASNDTDPLGKQMLTSDRFHTIARFIDGVALLGFKPNHIVINPKDDNNLYLNHAVGATSPVIIFKDQDDLEIILDNLALSMSKPEFANEINSKYATLLYIDLRFNNKVLYKFQ